MNEGIEEGVLFNSTNDSVDPYDYQVLKCGGGAFETMECNQIHGFSTDEEAKKDDGEENMWRAQRELVDCVEEQGNLDKPPLCNGSKEIMKIFV